MFAMTSKSQYHIWNVQQVRCNLFIAVRTYLSNCHSPEIVLITKSDCWEAKFVRVHDFDVNIGGVFEVI